jgi:hypothetical protein
MQERTADRTAIYTLAGVIAAATIAFVGTEWAARTSFDAQMVQIGVGILSADPGKSDVARARMGGGIGRKAFGSALQLRRS